MARARNIKPGFFKDAKVVSCSFPARLLFTGLWGLADYMGRLKYVPLEIKMELFPADDVNISELMDELANQKLIEIYTDDSGAALVQVAKFSVHQNPHINERQDKDKNPLPFLPGPEECPKTDGAKDEENQVVEEEKPTKEQQLSDALVLLREYSGADPADSLNLIPDLLSLIPDSLIPIPDPPPKQKPPAKKPAGDYPEDFEIFWDLYPKKVGKKTSLAVWKKMTAAERVLAVEKLPAAKKSPKFTDDNGKWIKDPERWLKSGGWDDEHGSSHDDEMAAMIAARKRAAGGFDATASGNVIEGEIVYDSPQVGFDQ